MAPDLEISPFASLSLSLGLDQKWSVSVSVSTLETSRSQSQSRVSTIQGSGLSLSLSPINLGLVGCCCTYVPQCWVYPERKMDAISSRDLSPCVSVKAYFLWPTLWTHFGTMLFNYIIHRLCCQHPNDNSIYKLLLSFFSADVSWYSFCKRGMVKKRI